MSRKLTAMRTVLEVGVEDCAQFVRIDFQVLASCPPKQFPQIALFANVVLRHRHLPTSRRTNGS